MSARAVVTLILQMFAAASASKSRPTRNACDQPALLRTGSVGVQWQCQQQWQASVCDERLSEPPVCQQRADGAQQLRQPNVVSSPPRQKQMVTSTTISCIK